MTNFADQKTFPRAASTQTSTRTSTQADATAGDGATQDNSDPLSGLPTTPQDLYNHLDRLGVTYKVYEHEPVFTVEESAPLKANIPGAHCRNLFLRDKKKRNYLVVALNETQIDLKKLAGVIGSDRLSFGSGDRLWQYLGVKPGSVCPFAIINDTQNEVKIILDKDMMERELVNYHPLYNGLTIGLTPGDLTKFVESTGHTPHITDLTPAAPDQKPDDAYKEQL